MNNLEDKIRQDIEESDGEAWKKPHFDAMRCLDFEDALRDGMRQYRTLRDEDDAWSRGVYKGLIKFNPEVARHFRRRYEKWFAPCNAALVRIQEIEREYGILEQAEEFRRARMLVWQIMSTPIDEVIRSMDDIANGKYEDL